MMNPLNYASLEASKRLIDAGIVLETDLRWCKNQTGTGKEWFLANHKMLLVPTVTIPAPSMAEVWRELPLGTNLYKGIIKSQCWMDFNESNKLSSDCNPTDALIDILIWVRKKIHDQSNRRTTVNEPYAWQVMEKRCP